MLIYHIFIDFGDGAFNHEASPRLGHIQALFRFATASFNVRTWVTYGD